MSNLERKLLTIYPTITEKIYNDSNSIKSNPDTTRFLLINVHINVFISKLIKNYDKLLKKPVSAKRSFT